MITSELFIIVDKYVQKNISLEELEDWIVPRLPFFFRLPLSQASEFVAGIELGLAEISNGSRTEEEFRNMLSELLREADTIWLSYPLSNELSVSSSANKTSLSAIYEPSKTLSLVYMYS